MRQRAARQSMERLLRLQKVTSELSQALTPEQVASVIVRQAGPAMGACEACIYLLTAPGMLHRFKRWECPRMRSSAGVGCS
ncbi:hypothetical protein ACN28S_05260 [Cystobacter fuscus]